jgi:plastocyanin
MRASLTVVMAAVLLPVGCANGTPSTDDPVVETAPDGAVAPMDAEVDIRRFDFGDDVVEIGVGGTVTWTNRDATRHTVTSGVDGEPDGAFEVTFDDRGEVGAVTFDEPGEYHYFCRPHGFMTGTVVVTG